MRIIIDKILWGIRQADSDYITWVGTQAEYDNITTKDPNTLYYIKE